MHGSNRWMGMGAKLACLLTLLGGLPTSQAQDGNTRLPASVIGADAQMGGFDPELGGIEEPQEGGHAGGFDSSLPPEIEIHPEHEDTGFFVEFTGLLMKPRRDADDFAILDLSGPAGGVLDGDIQSVNWDSDFGYRVKGGYRLGHGWEFAGSYFYLHASQDRTVTAPAGGSVNATFTIPTFDLFTSGVASTSLDMDVVDVELAKTLVLDEDLVLRLSAGPRVATIQQKLLTAYAGGVVGNGGFSAEAPVSMDAYGARVGSEMHYRPCGCSGLSLFATAHLSLLRADFRAKNVQTMTTAGVPNLVLFLSDKYESMVPVTEITLGIAWTGENVRFSIGYELANFFNMVNTPTMIDNADFGLLGRRTSDLSLEGLAVKIGLYF